MRIIRKGVTDMSRQRRSIKNTPNWIIPDTVERDKTLVIRIVIIVVLLSILLPLLTMCSFTQNFNIAQGGKQTIEDLGAGSNETNATGVQPWETVRGATGQTVK